MFLNVTNFFPNRFLNRVETIRKLKHLLGSVVRLYNIRETNLQHDMSIYITIRLVYI